jgi:hypothetical protein
MNKLIAELAWQNYFPTQASGCIEEVTSAMPPCLLVDAQLARLLQVSEHGLVMQTELCLDSSHPPGFLKFLKVLTASSAN